jgi:hypothetical protein
MVSPFFSGQGPHLRPRGQDTDFDGICQRGVHEETAPAIPQERGPQPDPVCHARGPFPFRRLDRDKMRPAGITDCRISVLWTPTLPGGHLKVTTNRGRDFMGPIRSIPMPRGDTSFRDRAVSRKRSRR